jgi:hypothetical protein
MFTNYFTDHFSYYPACKPLLAGWINDREGGQEPPQYVFFFVDVYNVVVSAPSHLV